MRLALITGSPSPDDTVWRTCPRGHGFAGLSKGRTVRLCPACGSEKHDATPAPLVSCRLLWWVMREAGLPAAGDPRLLVGALTEPDLAARLAAHAPNLVVTLGDEALRAFHSDPEASASNWRGNLYAGTLTLGGTHSDNGPGDGLHAGSLVMTACSPSLIAGSNPAGVGVASTLPADGVADGSHPSDAVSLAAPWTGKCMAALDPTRLAGQGDQVALLRADLRRAATESLDPVLTLPERHIEWQLTAAQIVDRLHALMDRGDAPVGHDLEGFPGTGITDFSFATSPTHAFWVPFRRMNWARWWPADDEARIMEATRLVLESTRVRKVCHNAISEMFTWLWAHEITLRGLADDTMLRFHELYAEHEKNLSTVASLLTRQPYWGEADDAITDEERALYNCTDSMVTLAVNEAIDALREPDGTPEWTPGMESHYRHRLSLLPAVLHQQMEGIPFDVEARDALVERLDADIHARQGELDVLAGIAPPTITEVARTVCNANAVKKGLVVTWDDVVMHANPTWQKRCAVAVPARGDVP
jgi:hypothetical protein